MNSIDRVSQGVQIAANLGVVLSIAFLAYQIGEQRELMKAQTRTAISSEVIGLLVSQATDEGLASAVRRDYAGEELSLDDRFRMDRLSRAYFRYWENVYYQYRNGLYDEEEFQGSRVALKDRLSRPGVMATWCETEKLYSPEFITEVKRLLPSGSSCATSADPH
jgi:hypothetical protein